MDIQRSNTAMQDLSQSWTPPRAPDRRPLHFVALALSLFVVPAVLFASVVWYQTEETLGVVQTSGGKTVAKKVAAAGTIIAYDGSGNVSQIGFSTDGNADGEYGIAGGVPKNKGRLIYKQDDPSQGIPYNVTGGSSLCVYHLKYLELTTVGSDARGYKAFATKAVAFDNKADCLPKAAPFPLPSDGSLTIVNGRIKFGEKLVTPDYGLKGSSN